MYLYPIHPSTLSLYIQILVMCVYIYKCIYVQKKLWIYTYISRYRVYIYIACIYINTITDIYVRIHKNEMTQIQQGNKVKEKLSKLEIHSVVSLLNFRAKLGCLNHWRWLPTHLSRSWDPDMALGTDPVTRPQVWSMRASSLRNRVPHFGWDNIPSILRNTSNIYYIYL